MDTINEQLKTEFLQVLTEQPLNLQAWNNLGVIYKEEGLYNEAQECFENALIINKDYVGAIYNLAFVHLALGNLKDGLECFEYRCRIKNKMENHNIEEPLPVEKKLKKETNLDGKTLYICIEKDFQGGFGDTIMLSRYIKLFENCRIIMDVQPQLLDILTENFPNTEYNLKNFEYDYHIPIFSLPYFFNTRITTIPFAKGYLRANPDKINFFKEKYFKTKNLKVGICYQGNQTYYRNRSIDVELLEDLFELEGADFYSFQTEKEIKKSKKTIDIGATFKNFSDTASALSNLDILITIDTSIAHLAGALGITTWLLLPNIADWRWFIGRNNSPWYQSIRLFRQKKQGDWLEVIARVKDELRNLLV